MGVVIITGASTGIGRHAAESLAHRGYTVFAGVRNQKAFDELAKTSGIRPVIVDVVNQSQVDGLVKTVEAFLNNRTERVDLINNAGIAVAGPVECVSIEQWKNQFDVNVFGLLRVSQALLPLIRKTQGRIINIGSLSGLVTNPGMGAYCASKHAVEAISDAMRMELKEFGVKVTLIEPGPIETPIWDKNLEQKKSFTDGWSEDLRQIYGGKIEKFVRAVSEFSKSAIPAEHVTNSIVSALESSSPKARDKVASAFVPVLMKVAGMLPTKTRDSILIKRSGFQ